MLRLYRRHRRACGHRSERHRRCACPIYVEGSLRGEHIRRALDLTSWEAASALIREWDVAGRIGGVEVVAPPIAEAVEQYLADAKARGLTASTLKKYRNVLENHLLGFCRTHGFRELRQLRVEALRQLREGWTLAPRSQQKALDTLRNFFRFCEASEWIPKNPARNVKAPRVETNPTLPLSEDEVQKLLDACNNYRGNGQRVRAMVLVLRYTGLRISDAVSLRREALGIDIETVAVLLGHSSSATTRKHYNPWVQSRQRALEAAVRQSWSQHVRVS